MIARDLIWWYWLATMLLLGLGLAGGPLGFLPVIALSTWQVIHFHLREGALGAFPVQVRIGYLGLLLLAQWEPLHFIYWIQFVGTSARVTVGYCTLARVMSLLPWNRREQLSWSLVRRTFLTPPVKGSVLPNGREH